MLAHVFISAILSFGIFTAINLKIKISGLKIMLLGMGLIAFSNAVLKGMVQGDADVIISLIGFGILLSGFFITEN
jgi:hypothetical protein